MDNGIELTMLSKHELDLIRSGDMSPSEAFAYLNSDINSRTFSDILNTYGKGENLSAVLTSKLCEYSPEAKTDSVARKVRDWIGGKYAPTSREDYFKISFALGLNEDETNGFLQLSTDGAIHMRDPKELVYAFSLRTGKTYEEANALFSSLKPLDSVNNKKSSRVLTQNVMKGFSEVGTEEEFIEFYNENYDNLGSLHNTAYSVFINLLNVLIHPDNSAEDFEDEKKYSIDDVVDTYLRMNVVSNKKTSDYSPVQKLFKKYWPNSTNITRIKNRDEDVPRRVLLLLYLITDGAVNDEEYYYEEDFSAYELFEEQYWKIDSMLNDCGMSRLDPRNVFDWLILFSIKASEDESMNERFQSVLEKIFE